MGRICICPIEPWKGNIEFADPMTMPQALAWEAAVTSALDVKGVTAMNAAFLPGLLACIEACEIEGLIGHLSVSTFPASPRLASAKLIDWMAEQVSAIYQGVQVPNA